MAGAFEIRGLASLLNLKHIANGDIDLTDSGMDNMEYLYKVLYSEYSMRQDERKKRALKESRLPLNKQFDDTLISDVLAAQIDYLLDFDFNNNIRNVIIYGKSCTGKTSLACEIGKNAIKNGAKVLYTTFIELIDVYQSQKSPWRLIVNSDVVIIDDFLYLLPSTEEMLIFYKVISFLIESRSIIIVSNRDILNWGELGYDEYLMETIFARLNNKSQQLHL